MTEWMDNKLLDEIQHAVDVNWSSLRKTVLISQALTFWRWLISIQSHIFHLKSKYSNTCQDEEQDKKDDQNKRQFLYEHRLYT